MEEQRLIWAVVRQLDLRPIPCVPQQAFVRLEATRWTGRESFFVYVFARIRMRAKTWIFLCFSG